MLELEICGRFGWVDFGCHLGPIVTQFIVLYMVQSAHYGQQLNKDLQKSKNLATKHGKKDIEELSWPLVHLFIYPT
jgi:hypothetical protein